MKSTLFLCTCPASKVSRAAFFGGSPEVVRHDHHEPLSCELVASLPCPGHHHHYHAIVHAHNELSHCHQKTMLVEAPSPAPIEALNVIVPDDTRTAVRLPHCVNLQVRPKVHDLDFSFGLFALVVCLGSPFLAAGRLNCCTLEGRRRGWRRTRGQNHLPACEVDATLMPLICHVSSRLPL